jgi:hypothetical protein
VITELKPIDVLPVQTAFTAPPALPSPMAMIERAVEQGAGIEVLTKLMDLQDRWEKNQARRAFDEAIASAKAELGPVTKNAKGHNDKRYANFAAYAAAVDPVISKFGLSYRFRTSQSDRISVTCVLSHRLGHSEENTLTGPADKTGSKNDIQAIGSTLTYLQRYSLIQALGLAASDDDDGVAAGRPSTELIDSEQIATLLDKIKATGTDLEAFCKAYRIEAIPDLPLASYQHALGQLQRKAARK